MQIQIWKARTWCRWISSGSLGLLEGYGGQFEAAEHGGIAVDIDSSLYVCNGTIQQLLGCVWLCWRALLSVCLWVCMHDAEVCGSHRNMKCEDWSLGAYQAHQWRDSASAQIILVPETCFKVKLYSANSANQQAWRGFNFWAFLKYVKFWWSERMVVMNNDPWM